MKWNIAAVLVLVAFSAYAVNGDPATEKGRLSAKLEKSLNDQINMELKASYLYMDMAQFFGRPDVGYRGLHKFFSKMSHEERDHAMKFIEYVNKRQGTVTLSNVQASSWSKTTTLTTENGIGAPLLAMKKAEKAEQDVYESLLEIHKEARDDPEDPHLQDFLEGEFLTEQVDSLKTFKEFLSVLTRLGKSAVGLQMFDEELYNEKRG